MTDVLTDRPTACGDGQSSSPTSWSLDGGKVGPLLGAVGAEQISKNALQRGFGFAAKWQAQRIVDEVDEDRDEDVGVIAGGNP